MRCCIRRDRGGGEAYIRGLWRADDLTSLIRLMIVNRDVMQSMKAAPRLWPRRCGASALAQPQQPGWQPPQHCRALRLGNDLFALMLDETMTYSCGVFEREDATLHEAQFAKFERICRKLRLSPNDRLVEIGTAGWTRDPCASRYGCHVTTTTISREQHDWRRRRSLRQASRTASRSCSTTTATCTAATTSWSPSR